MQRILVIEDENDIRQLLRFNLEREGFAVLEAADGLGGLHMATSELPDLVVLDLMLPGMDGCDVCRGSRPSRSRRPSPCSCSRPAARKWTASWG